MAYDTQKFLSRYGVHHMLSSVVIPHSNQRAELAVKSMKRLLRENVGLDGKLNTDKFQRAVMQYRNTPDRDTGRSPAQVIFGRELRDFLPAPLSRYKPQKQWLLLQEDRENALRKRALRNTEKLDSHTHKLAPLQVQDTVQVQNQIGFKASRWDVTGVIVEVKEHDQYVVKIHGSGRMTLRNRKFLKKIIPYCQSDSDRPNVPVQPHVPVSQPGILDSEADDHQHASQAPFPEPPVLGGDTVPEQHADLQDVPVQQLPEVAGKPVQQLPEPADTPVLRRSARTSVEPDRLNVGSWKGQTYTSVKAGSVVQGSHGAVHNVDLGNHSLQTGQAPRQLGIWCYNMTAPYSVAQYYGLLHSVPGGGGGISGYVMPRSLLPNSYQTMHWPQSHVHTTRLAGPQLHHGWQ